ncbi:MAG: GtrA family protein [Demequina sp.]|uniref:GtrA family protein n=1 Tax=Demequina sp. TaxID=2050685 RepID=UPI003A8A1DD7
MAEPYPRLRSSLVTILDRVRARAGELLRFGAVGLAGIVVNLGVFNLLRLGPLAPDAHVAGDDDRVVTAKIIATLVSILFAWVAHRGWTFRGPSRHRPLAELALFGLINAVALLIEAGAVAISHHGLGYTSLAADNLASVVGIGLGTIARYAGFSLFVFSSEAAAPHVSAVEVAADPAAPLDRIDDE